MLASQLSGHCDVISNRLWRHRQNVNRANETSCRCMKIVFSGIYGFVMSCKKLNDVCTPVTNCLCAHSSVILVFICLVAAQLHNNTTITLEWAHKQFTTYTVFYKIHHVQVEGSLCSLSCVVLQPRLKQVSLLHRYPFPIQILLKFLASDSASKSISILYMTWIEM